MSTAPAAAANSPSLLPYVAGAALCALVASAITYVGMGMAMLRTPQCNGQYSLDAPIDYCRTPAILTSTGTALFWLAFAVLLIGVARWALVRWRTNAPPLT